MEQIKLRDILQNIFLYLSSNAIEQFRLAFPEDTVLIDGILNDQEFWFLKSQQIVKIEKIPGVDWKKLYSFLTSFPNLQEVFYEAIKTNYIFVVELLLGNPNVDPGDQDNQALVLAAKMGHAEIVALLLEDPRVDPTDQYNRALKEAARNNHSEVMKLLLKDPRVDPYERSGLTLVERLRISRILNRLKKSKIS